MERSAAAAAAAALNKPLSFRNDEVALSPRFAVHIDRHKQNAEIVTEEITKSPPSVILSLQFAAIYRTLSTRSLDWAEIEISSPL